MKGITIYSVNYLTLNRLKNDGKLVKLEDYEALAKENTELDRKIELYKKALERACEFINRLDGCYVEQNFFINKAERELSKNG